MSSFGISHNDRSDMDALLSATMCRETPWGGTVENTDAGLPDDNEDDSGEAIRGDRADEYRLDSTFKSSLSRFGDLLVSTLTGSLAGFPNREFSIIIGLLQFNGYWDGSIWTARNGGSVLRGRVAENPDVMLSPQLVVRSRPWKLSRFFDNSGNFRPSFDVIVAPNRTRRTGSLCAVDRSTFGAETTPSTALGTRPVGVSSTASGDRSLAPRRSESNPAARSNPGCDDSFGCCPRSAPRNRCAIDDERRTTAFFTANDALGSTLPTDFVDPLNFGPNFRSSIFDVTLFARTSCPSTAVTGRDDGDRTVSARLSPSDAGFFRAGFSSSPKPAESISRPADDARRVPESFDRPDG